MPPRCIDPRISIITLGTENLERARKFYRDGLGIPLRDETDDETPYRGARRPNFVVQ